LQSSSLLTRVYLFLGHGLFEVSFYGSNINAKMSKTLPLVGSKKKCYCEYYQLSRGFTEEAIFVE
jgi:hypothetical protein